MKNERLIFLIKEKYGSLENYLNEKGKRIWAATEARSYGWGGVSAVHMATGIDFKTIRKGLLELKSGNSLANEGLRKNGSGRKKISSKEPCILKAIKELIEVSTRGDPESPLKWTCKSSYQVAEELNKQGYTISQKSVYTILTDDLNYSLQSNKKTAEGDSHPDRDAQFKYINKKIKQFQSQNCPTLSIDTKKKENIGNFLIITDCGPRFCSLLV